MINKIFKSMACIIYFILATPLLILITLLDLVSDDAFSNHMIQIWKSE